MLDNLKLELQGYEYVGLCYYYLGELSIAEHYHQKMING
jgi:hypothetical protein